MARAALRVMIPGRVAAGWWRAVFVGVLAAGLVAMAAPALFAQERGAERLHLLMRGLTVTGRVLVLGTQPEDADADLIAWLARGRMVETGYLSLTRGEAGENYAGRETGVTLGAIRTAEALAARRVDGGRQYFSRAYDIGFARNAEAVFKQWDRDTLLSQLVVVIRSFRPHVLINSFAADLKDGDGQHEALTMLATDAFAAAGDTVKFPAKQFGAPWTPFKRYEHGPGVLIDANEFDPVLGRTYRDVAFESRAQQRSHGISDASLRRSGLVQLRLVASHVNGAVPTNGATPLNSPTPSNGVLSAGAERSLFEGIDTSFARLERGFPRDVNHTLRQVSAYADSARNALRLEQPAGVVRLLARAADAAASARINMPWCRHPSRDAHFTAGRVVTCSAESLDLDASFDVVLRRVNEALLLAAGVTIESAADRDLIGWGDSARVAVTVSNHGAVPVTLREVTVTGSQTPLGAPPMVIPPDSAGRVVRRVAGLSDPHPWWIAKRAHNFYFPTEAGLDGLTQTTQLKGLFSILGMAEPEDLHRTSDVSVLLDVAGAFVSLSAGPVQFPDASPLLGAREFPLAEVPPVTLAFERSLEWVVARKKLNREFRVMLKSYSDSTQRFTPKAFLPKGLHAESLPRSITLAPREQRILFLSTRGLLEADRHEFGFFGQGTPPMRFTEGFRTIQYPWLPPIRVFRGSAMYLQGVNIEVPRGLSVAYVQGVGDDVAAALKQIGIPTVVIDPDDLLRLDLSTFSTVVIGPRAIEIHPELVGKTALLQDFARKGGAVVMMHEPPAVIAAHVLPFAVTFAAPPERVTAPDAPVAVLDHGSRLFRWPNVIAPEDWSGWQGDRALLVPSAADSRYGHPMETHDPGEHENGNTILTAPLGKGVFIYTTLSLAQQIALGVPGALRLMVNMLSAGLPGPGDASGRAR